MSDLDRWEEHSREQRGAGGPYDPEPAPEPHWAHVPVVSPRQPLPALPRPVRPGAVLPARAEVVRYWTWAPAWETQSIPMVTFTVSGLLYETPQADCYVRPTA